MIHCFDKVYIINFLESPERREFMKEQIKILGIKNVKFFNAINYEKIFHKFWIKSNKTPDGTDTDGLLFDKINGQLIDSNLNQYPEMGCAISHYSCVKEAYELGYERILIMEDDVCLLKSTNIIEQYCNDIPDDIDVILYNFNIQGKFAINKIADERFVKMPKSSDIKDFESVPIEYGCAAFYSLNRKAMKIYLEQQEKDMKRADQINYIWHNCNEDNSPLNVYTTSVSIGFPQIFLNPQSIWNKRDFVKSHIMYHNDMYFQPDNFLKSTLREGR